MSARRDSNSPSINIFCTCLMVDRIVLSDLERIILAVLNLMFLDTVMTNSTLFTYMMSTTRTISLYRAMISHEGYLRDLPGLNQDGVKLFSLLGLPY